MQYFGKAIGTVSRTWNSLNPSTLSGAIDVVVVKQNDGHLHCSAFHIRFGKLSLLRPSEKTVDFYVNGNKINTPMKLGEGGEAFFVFGTDADVPESLLTSPVVSPAGSPKPEKDDGDDEGGSGSDQDIEYLDISGKQSLPSSPKAPEEEDTFEPRLRDQKPSRIDEIIKRLQRVNIPSSHGDNTGSVIMDATGYKAGGQNTKELEKVVSNLLNDEDPLDSPPASPPGSPKREVSAHEEYDPATPPNRSYTSEFSDVAEIKQEKPQRFVKTLRLSSDTLKSLNLKPGKNEMKFVVRYNNATVTANIFLWDSHTPVVISDIDGTITKSDAMGHLMTFVGRDWTHAGVGRLFTDIHHNGYNIMYLTSRSVGLADGTRGYLESIIQDGVKLPPGPVILSPDRTMAALRREVIMRKPEIFKMACLRDIQKLYMNDYVEDMTPFYAGFGNRITDALSYRSVGVPSTKIFTIDTDSEVKLELLELTGIKSSYILITDLVDQLFPPVVQSEGNPTAGLVGEFTDANYWRQPLVQLSDDEDDSKEVVSVSSATARVPSGGGLDWRNKISATFSDSSYSGDDDDSETDSE